MVGLKIKDGRSLEAWLGDEKPRDWIEIIAVRIAMRAFPKILEIRNELSDQDVVSAFRALFFGWVNVGDPLPGMRSGKFDANEAAHKVFKKIEIKNLGAASAAQSIFIANEVHFVAPHAYSKILTESANSLGRALNDSLWAWQSLSEDCNWLQATSVPYSVGRTLGRRRLWQKPPMNWLAQTEDLLGQLLMLDQSYSVWIDWFQRRISGRGSSFDIPGDKARSEDRRIIRRLAAATDEDFWNLGHEFVNTTLKGWIDEARARCAPPPEVGTDAPTPPQDPGATAYGINPDGKLDRLPHSDQVHLRDVPDQRRAYADLRTAAGELREEGQRLGARLEKALDRLLTSLPERFGDAEAYLVWRDANALRRLYRAHVEASKSREPDEAKLEPVIAEGLGGLIDLYNNFAFADDGLRAKDEARISPQERANAEAEALAGAPVVGSILSAPGIATPEARDDIATDADNASLPADDPYAAQVLDQANRTRRNWIAGLISDTWSAFKTANPLIQNLVASAVWDGIKLTATAVGGIEYAPMLQFIASNVAALQHYVAIAFPTYEHLPQLIAQIKALWERVRRA